MPFVIGIFAAVGAMVGAVGAAAIVIGAVVTVGAVVGGSLLMGQLMPAPGSASPVANTGYKVTQRSSNPSRQVVYGRRQIHAAEIYKGARGSNNEYLDVVHVLTTHEIDALEAVVIDGDTVSFDGSGHALGKYAGFLQMEFKLGSPTQAALSDMVSFGVFNSNDRGRGCALVHLEFKYDQNVWPNGEPTDIAYTIRGKKVWDPRTGAIAYSDNASLIQADYLLDPVPNSREVFGYLEKDVLSASMLSQSGLGSFNAAAAVDGDLTAAAWDTIAAGPGATAYVDLGVGNSMQAVLARVYCLAGSSAAYDVQWTDDGVHWTTVGRLYAEFPGWNSVRLATLGAHRFWALGLVNTPGAGSVAEVEFYDSAVDVAQLIADANLSDEAVALNGGGTEPRYVACGAYTMDATPKAIMESMLTASLGISVWRGGKWYLYGAAWRGPTVTLTDDDLRGPFRYSPLVSRTSQYNAVQGQFVAEKNTWQQTDYPVVRLADAIQQDGEVIYKKIDFPWTPTASACQRLATLQAKRDRMQGTGQLQCKLSAYQLQPPDVFQFTRARESWTNKAFEIGPDFALVLENDAQGAPVMGVNMAIRETDSSVYTWAGNEAADLTPSTTTGNDGRTVAAPSGVSVTDGYYTRKDGIRLTWAELQWTVAADPLVLAGFVQIQYKKHADSTWITASGAVVGNAVNFYIMGLDDGVAYDFQVRFYSALKVVGPWTQVLNHTVSGSLSDIPTSTILNSQGSIPPGTGTAGPYTLTTGGPATGKMFGRAIWSAHTRYRTDQSTYAIPASSSLAVPAAPSLSNITSANTLGNRTYYVRYAYVKDGVIFAIGGESSGAWDNTTLAKVLSPAVAAGGYDGWIPLIGSASNGEVQQTTTPGSPANPVPFGTDWVEPSTGARLTGGTTVADDGTGNAFRIWDQAVSIHVYAIPSWDIKNGLLGVPTGFSTTNVAPDLAIKAFGDGHDADAGGWLDFSIPAAGGSGGGGGAGGCPRHGFMLRPLRFSATGQRMRGLDWSAIDLANGTHAECTARHAIYRADGRGRLERYLRDLRTAEQLEARRLAPFKIQQCSARPGDEVLALDPAGRPVLSRVLGQRAYREPGEYENIWMHRGHLYLVGQAGAPGLVSCNRKIM